MNSYFSTFLCTGVLYTMMIKKKRITAALLALGLGAVTMFSQFPVSAAEETAQNTDSRSVCRSHQRYRRMAPGFRYFVCRSNCNGNFH